MVKFTAMEFYCLEKDKSATFSCILYIGSEPPPLISGEQKSNGGLVHLYLKGLNKYLKGYSQCYRSPCFHLGMSSGLQNYPQGKDQSQCQLEDNGRHLSYLSDGYG